MKKSAFILITFIVLGACQEDISPDLSEIEEEALDIAIDLDVLTDIEEVEVPIVEFEEEIFTVVETMPQFDGGNSAWNNYVDRNLKWPKTQFAAEGRVYISFVVDKDGNVANAQLAKGIHPAYDQEALKVLVNSPRWVPGTQRGRKVNTLMNVAITFRNDK